MFIIGLTGGIGSGKSTAANILKEMGLKIIDLDQISHNIMKAEEPGYNKILKNFGDKYLDKNNNFDRKHLRDDMFSSIDLKQRIELILHPIIFEECKNQLNKLSHEEFVVLVVPLLFETKNYTNLISESLLIDCDLKSQIKRVIKRDGLSEVLVKKIVASQMSRDRKLSLANKVIYNNGNMNNLKTQLENYYKNLL